VGNISALNNWVSITRNGVGDGRMWVGGTGWFSGTFARDWLSIPATGKKIRIRWGELCRVKDGRISEVFTLLDIVDLMQQAGLRVRNRPTLKAIRQTELPLDKVHHQPQGRRAERIILLDALHR
jgi:hypothetical protein